jgi:hypothetical protein
VIQIRPKVIEGSREVFHVCGYYVRNTKKRRDVVQADYYVMHRSTGEAIKAVLENNHMDLTFRHEIARQIVKHETED